MFSALLNVVPYPGEERSSKAFYQNIAELLQNIIMKSLEDSSMMRTVPIVLYLSLAHLFMNHSRKLFDDLIPKFKKILQVRMPVCVCV